MQFAGIGILSLVGWGLDLMPGNTSWIPSVVLWALAAIWSIVILIYWLKTRKHLLKPNTADGQSRLNLEVRGRIGGNARIFDTPKGDNPPWILQDPSYADGLLWGINLLFVNKEPQPINITTTMLIPMRKDDPSKGIRLSPLSKPIYEHRDKSIFYFQPQHLAFPVYIDSGKAVNGHVEFAMDGLMWDTCFKLGSLKQIIFGHENILEVEDFLSGKKAEFKL